MSKTSDKYELDVGDFINKVGVGFKAIRPKANTKYSDIILCNDRSTSWLEVKMNHTDNLSNPRVFYSNKSWQSSYSTPVAQYALNRLNSSITSSNFVIQISEMYNINPDIVYISTTLGGLKLPDSVQLNQMKNYFISKQLTKYILEEENVDIGKLATDHYILGKTEPAHYMQAGDDFYLISNHNPLGLSNSIPLLSGLGDFKVRVSTRSKFYEIQAEVKIKEMPESEYSLKPGTMKKNPLSCIF